MTEDTCSDCHGLVRWVITETGRRVELDPLPADGGNVVPVVVDGHVRARILTGDQLPAQRPAWRRHAATCPESVDARKRRAKAAPRCRVCQFPMDPDLAVREQWDTHPACDPAEGADTVRAALAAAQAPPPDDQQLDLAGTAPHTHGEPHRTTHPEGNHR